MSVDHTKNIIELSDVSFQYDREEVLKDITFNLHQGDYLGIIGPNGGGKTTLLKIMVGLLKPHQGTVKLFGKPIAEFRDWYKIGYVPQKVVNFDTNFPITVEEVVAMGRYGQKGLLNNITKTDKELIKQSLEHVEMWEYKDRLIGDLSGGQQQRVFIARALASEPEVIFLDEPTAGIDVKNQEQFYILLQELNKKLNKTLVLVSHDINAVAHEVTELVCINKTLVYDSDPKQFLKNDDVRKLYGAQMTFILHKH